MERGGVNVSASLSKPVHGEIEAGIVLRDSACKSKIFGKNFEPHPIKGNINIGVITP